MSLDINDYAGANLPPRILSFLTVLRRHGVQVQVSGPSQKTIRLFSNGRNLGYINGTVVRRGGLIGYHFVEENYNSDSCPDYLKQNLIEEFCRRYDCDETTLDAHEGKGSNVGRLFLLLKDPAVALSVLQLDSGNSSDPESVVVEISNRFVEGKIIEVLSQRRERDPKARAACLAEYGFDCFVCGANLRRRYSGLPVEVIHVHHEEPLYEAASEREFDPLATMKPLCPNCHCVAHSRTPPYSISELKEMVSNET